MLFIPRGGLRMQGVRYGGAEHEVDDWKGGLVETAEGGGRLPARHCTKADRSGRRFGQTVKQGRKADDRWVP
jgi:hypothetical protein